MGSLIFLLLVLNACCASFSYKKCCAADSYLKRNLSNFSYICAKDEDKRIQILSDERNFLENRTEGTCYDNYLNITEYKISNETVIDEKPISVNFYPKCCPLGYFYQSTVHSCVHADDLDEEFITESFVKVGLPHCKIIVDFNFTEEHKIELGKLYKNETLEFGEEEFCVDRNENGSLTARGCYQDLDVCYDGLTCLRKCCPDGQSFVNGTRCENTYIHGLDLSFTDKVNKSKNSFAIIHGFDKALTLIFLLPKYLYYIDATGDFYLFYNNTNAYHRFSLEDNFYCIEHVYKGTRNSFRFFMYLEKVSVSSTGAETKILVGRWAKLVSCVFILIILGVYFFIPEMMNLFGKILVGYCVAKLVMFITLTYVQFEREIIGDTSCVSRSFFLSYMSMVSFAWLNVMCFNIWCTLGKSKISIRAHQRSSEIKKFLLYSLYTWGLPAVLTFLTFVIYHWVNTPYVIRPFLGKYKCFWELRYGNYGKLLYYVAPLLLLQLINVVLFVQTVLYCLKVKREINRMNDNGVLTKQKRTNYNLDKEQLLLISKLGIIMGILLVFEVVSSFSDFSKNAVTKYVEVVWDTINCLEGVFLFLIFICKRKVYCLCLNRLKIANGRKASVTSLRTYATQMTEQFSQC